MALLRILVVFCLLCCFIGTESLNQSRSKRSNDQIDTLRKKLSSLQDLLTSMTKEDEKLEKSEKSPPTTVLPEDIRKGQEIMMTRSNENEAENSKVKLSSDEVAVLMALKETLQRQQQQNRKSNSALKEELEQKQSYYDKPIAEDGTDEVTVLKALASKLSKDRDDRKQKSPENTKDESVENGTVQPKEGKFTLFRQEVLAQVEDRLLQDMDFALKMGFSVEEILSDLQVKETRFKELKLEELRHRIESLRELRD